MSPRPSLSHSLRFAFSAGVAAMLSLGLLSGCDYFTPSKPKAPPMELHYWRAISNPNVLMTMAQAQTKLRYDLAQCKCSNFPLNVPHSEMAAIEPDLGRLAETSATKQDGQVDKASACVTSPSAVLLECMRARGWEPTACSGRLNTSGGVECAVSDHSLPDYPDQYPYKNPQDAGFGSTGDSPAEAKQNYPK